MSNSENIAAAFERLNVLVLGDVMIDRYLLGQVSRISPEAPVPVVHFQRSEDRLGGAANVALNIKALGATPWLCTVVGAGPDSERLLNLLPPAGLSDQGIVASPNRITTVKTRIIATNQQLLRVDKEETGDIAESDAEILLQRIRELLDHQAIDVILFQDYNKGVLSPKIINDVMLEALRRDIPTVVDPKYHNFWAYKHATLFKPNLKEIRAQASMAISPELPYLQIAAEEVRNRLGNRFTMITLSEKGLFLDGDSRRFILPTEARDIADVSGAGDTVISVAALGIALGMDMEPMAALANLAGGQVCERPGVVPVDKKSLFEAFYAFMDKRGGK
ncbi:MAG: bifunctional ADP-heptose synthase [Saprospiraceae bacterium]|nr:bifunctional ADP-heptose synthase [Saprospiraceae bacterium]MDZ4704617.1 bifunctional ADP-heptose synthase [Saprospiraceae bacterium]